MDKSAPNTPIASIKQNVQWIWVTRAIILAAFLDLFLQFPIIAPYARSLGAAGIMVGIIVATYSGANLIGNLVAGVILDKWGRKRPLIVGMLVTAVALLGYVFSETPQQLLAVRALHGLTAAILTPGAFAVLGDSARAGQRANVMGISGAFIAIAAVVGPLISGFMRDRQGPEAVFLLSAALILVTCFIFWYITRKWVWIGGEILHQERSEIKTVSWRIPRLIVAYLAALALTIGLGTLITHLPIVLTTSGESATRIGLTFTSFAVVAMIVIASPLNRMSDRFGRLMPILAGLGSISLGMIELFAAGGFLGSMVGMGLFGFGFGILFPAVTALVAESVQRYQRGRAFGIFYAVFSLGVVIGSMVSGLLSDRLSESALLPYLVSAIFALAIMPTISIVWHFKNSQSSHRDRGEI